MKEFSDFLRGAKVPVVTKDMWAQTLAFFCLVDADLSNFDVGGKFTRSLLSCLVSDFFVVGVVVAVAGSMV